MSDKIDNTPRKNTKKSPPQTTGETVVQIPLTELHPLPNHPFKVRDDESMRETAKSIKPAGIIAIPAG